MKEKKDDLENLGKTKPVKNNKLVNSLERNLTADICVIGAGIAGLTTAFLLSKSGKSVIVLEKDVVGSGETGKTTAHLSYALNDRYFDLEQIHGADTIKLVAQSHDGSITLMEKITKEERISCEFERVSGYLFVPPTETSQFLDRELATLHRMGFSRITKLANAPLHPFNTGSCLHFPKQAQMNATLYLAGLAKSIEKYGGKIIEHTPVHKILAIGDEPIKIKTRIVQIMAKEVVVATNSPIDSSFIIHTKQAAYRTYAISVRIPKGSVTKALYWDTLDPYHYVRISEKKDYDTLLVGGEDHKTGQEKNVQKPYEKLLEWTRERFPFAGKLESTWSGQVIQTMDGLAHIGHYPKNKRIYIATGDCGNGMTHGTIAGMIITDLIIGKKNPWTKLYDPSRITWNAASNFLKENMNVMVQFAHYLSTGDKKSDRLIRNGQGAIIRDGLKKVAVYRDVKGNLQKCSAVCPHFGGIVKWNTVEKTWDCPCHGSRFTPAGEVINGPAITALEKISNRKN